MFTDKSILIERINVAINKKWCQKSTDTFGLTHEFGTKNAYADLIDKNYSTHCQNAESIEILRHRVEELEHQNDQLLCFINFLLENLPDLVSNILIANREETVLPKQPPVLAENFKINLYKEKNDACPTRREKDILDLLIKGLCAKEIANRLYISETTVITHKKNLKEKFHARNTAELISKAQPFLSDKSNK